MRQPAHVGGGKGGGIDEFLAQCAQDAVAGREGRGRQSSVADQTIQFRELVERWLRSVSTYSSGTWQKEREELEQVVA